MATDKQVEFFLNSSSAVVELDLIEVTHSQFTKAHRFVRNAIDGVTLPNGDFYQYYPAKITTLTSEGNMDYGIKVALGDLSEVLPPEMKALQASDSLTEEPKVSHYVYRHDDLSEPLDKSVNLVMDDFNFNNKSSYFVSKAPTINNTKTGRAYNIEDFAMLGAFLR